MKNPLKKNQRELEKEMSEILSRIDWLLDTKGQLKRNIKSQCFGSDQCKVFRTTIKMLTKETKQARQDLHELKTLHTIVVSKGRG